MMKASQPYISLHSFFKITVGSMFKLVRWRQERFLHCKSAGIAAFFEGGGVGELAYFLVKSRFLPTHSRKTYLTYDF